jgi:hypothetical protein
MSSQVRALQQFACSTNDNHLRVSSWVTVKFTFVEAFTYDVVSAYEDSSNFGASWSAFASVRLFNC